MKGDEGLSIHRHPMCYVEGLDKCIKNLKVIVCIVCNAPFPFFDMIMCSY
jgi:hypothetical protein